MPSSVVAAMKYNPATSTLRIVYTSGSIYDYRNVPQPVYAEMARASSKGTFLNCCIKGSYSFKRIK